MTKPAAEEVNGPLDVTMGMPLNIAEIPVFILCGGLGTRLKEMSEFRPKPMVAIGPDPILLHIMKHYSSFGFRRFVLCMGYKSEIIRDLSRWCRALRGHLW
jgi:choline kinase